MANGGLHYDFYIVPLALFYNPYDNLPGNEINKTDSGGIFTANRCRMCFMYGITIALVKFLR